MALYFAYGSNMNLKQMEERCEKGWKKIGIGYVEGYRFVFDGYSSKWGGAVANLVRDPKEKVWGVLFELEDFRCLDIHEGHPTIYTREEVEVYIPADGKKVKAQAYIRPEPKDPGKPSRAYLETILEGAKENNLPKDWIAFLENYK